MTRRTRAVFDIALKVHQNIQQRDLEVGRNLGNWILRWLDKMKPSAQIRPPSHQKPQHGTGSANMNITKQVNNSSKTPRSLQTPRNSEADKRLFSSSTYMLSKSLPTIAMMIRPPKAAGNMTQYRHLSINGPHTLRLNYTRGEGVIRKDIMQWMLHNWRFETLFRLHLWTSETPYGRGRGYVWCWKLFFWKDTLLLSLACSWDNKMYLSSAFVDSFESICSSILLLGEHRCYDIVVMLYKICESFGLPLPYGNFLWTLFVITLNFT